MSSFQFSQFETAVMIRRILFFLVLISFTLLHLLPLFRGLDTPQAMEQAQIGRVDRRCIDPHDDFIGLRRRRGHADQRQFEGAILLDQCAQLQTGCGNLIRHCVAPGWVAAGAAE